MKLTAAVQLSYIPEQGQKLVLNASEKFDIRITESIAAKVRKCPMTEKAITEVIVGVQPEPDSLELPIEEKPVFKPIKLSAGIREKYFAETDPKEVKTIVDKALATWFKKIGGVNVR